jgi:hypothetical protein
MPGSGEAASLLDSYPQARRQCAEEAVRSTDGVQNDCRTGEHTGEQVGTEKPETA